MKFRTGFVTNSSSSSYLIVLDSIPKSPETLCQMVFGEGSDSNEDQLRMCQLFMHCLSRNQIEDIAELIDTYILPEDLVATPPLPVTLSQARKLISKQVTEIINERLETEIKYLENKLGSSLNNKYLFKYSFYDDGQEPEDMPVIEALPHVFLGRDS